jgi:inorganic phosphate transporter, PiT family
MGADMSAIADVQIPEAAPARIRFDHPIDMRAIIVFLAVLAGGLFFMAYSIHADVAGSGGKSLAILSMLLLGVAMLIALAFEFVNGFHDTANAVATVIYTNSLAPQYAVVWSGTWNFLGVMASTGAVAFGIVSRCRANSSCRSAPAPSSRWSSRF